ncbi:DUF732 domain-containing protein [Segniliparus rugosus]|uniref:DUF732 domain-containing protein n=1 Tax=Segniliparus rugosus (strain ATCC BAA-974 / DSM 45345 / CCUG 50838 / CIP 108380 / JCM 13579 / CDC 945) TaxID=679197 RepID=E5XUE3_SEGRC|nr:DUF732 domain-containing protein [Segniliparus rugosus]EFV12030.1 hypothetical protein HMPREF9336_03115 [Segniliparus rugosus ATCC BAA-974]
MRKSHRAKSASLGLLSLCLGLAACGGPSTERPAKTSTPVVGPTRLPDVDPASQSAPPPSGFPGPATPTPPPGGTKEQRFLDELRKAGVQVSPNGETELPVADLVCRSKKAGRSDQDIRTQVLAAAGLTGAQDPQKLADVWIKVATQSYCAP